MQAQARNHLWLDAKALRDFEQRFPSLTQRLASLGIHPGEDWIPVAPAAHHLAGGVMTDLSGATMLEGLWAAGEVADTGVHGANRLASNSLLEGLVFGSRVAEAIAEGQRGPSPTGVLRALLAPRSGGLGVDEVIASHDMADEEPDSDLSLLEIEKQRLALQQVMTDDAGVVRNAHGMEHAASVVGALARHQGESPATMAQGELSNLCEVARAMLAAALQRHESRGSHERQEFPERDPAWQRRLVHRGGGR
jgi:L-aspartate oxidase